jgi:hypothetical protein
LEKDYPCRILCGWELKPYSTLHSPFNQVLFLPLVTQGRDPINEKQLRRVCGKTDWRKQRHLWAQLKSRM